VAHPPQSAGAVKAWTQGGLERFHGNGNRSHNKGDVGKFGNRCYTPPMPRQPRLDAPGVPHHVMVRGLERRAIFRNDADRTDLVLYPSAQVHRLQACRRPFRPTSRTNP